MGGASPALQTRPAHLEGGAGGDGDLSGRGRQKAGMAMRIACAIGWPRLSWGDRKECWAALTRAEQDELLVAAKAVLIEMRKPSGRMARAACTAMSPEKRPTPARVGSKAKHAIRYQAMIDAALAELDGIRGD